MTIGFIGAGNMATALAGSISSSNPGVEIAVYDVNADAIARFSRAVSAVSAVASNVEVCAAADTVILAVKPQVMGTVLAEIATSENLLVSIAAGVRIATIEQAVPKARVVRVMPNTPALVGEMAAGYAGGAKATTSDMELVGRILSTAGVAHELSEELLDAVTGLSGSGPAFVARLIEAFVDSAVQNGLEHLVARELVLATFSGTARLLAKHKLTPEELVAMVSSPGGTTVAGRAVLEDSGYRDIIGATIRAAVDRSKELGA